ncbi:hypothetical protein Cgig2_020600 [Carnegiea gigantea]|uniref:Protein FLX-like 4 n=1 Tax=Carnegiea gigantea TaxID=171969 RepID=A0A9Q1JY67_9CARY|nr:hypothetical protein Cgig2_020600 [Carnegiea gigantea]
MSARGRPSAPGMMRHGPPPGVGASAGQRPLEPLPLELAEKEVIAQVAEIERLVMENRRLAASQGAMRQDLVSAREEIQRLRAHIRSTQTESDIQIRVLLDKTAKMESDIRAGDTIKKDLQQAHKEVQSLVAARQDLTMKIQQAGQELEKCRFDIKRIPDMLSELDSMRLEHQRLRSAFEHEKRINLDLVEHLQAMERNLVGMDKEVERLRAEVVNAEKRLQGPYGGAYPNADHQYPPPIHGNGPYYDPYGRAHIQGGMSAPLEVMGPHGNANGPSAPLGPIGGPPVSSAVPPVAWGGAYDPNGAQK